MSVKKDSRYSSCESSDFEKQSSILNNKVCSETRQERDLIIYKEIDVYCSRGWALHPLKGKLPHLKNWQQKASINPNTFMQWLKAWPNANIGIITGITSNLLVLDVDGVEGLNSIKGLDLPDTPTVITARGYHYYYQFPEVLKEISTTRSGLLPGVDTRGRGGFITAPPSIHETGHLYTWIKSPSTVPAAPPKWLIKLLLPPIKTACALPLLILKEGSRYAQVALTNESLAVATAPIGTRNARLNQAAFSMGTLAATGRIDINIVAESLARSALNAGLCQSEIEKTLCSGLSAGMKHPREVSHG